MAKVIKTSTGSGFKKAVSPGLGEVHVNRPLTNIAINFLQGAEAFVAMSAFPMVPVAQASNQYYVFDKDDTFRDDMEPRAAGTETAGGTYTLSHEAYNAVVYGIHKDVPDQVRANADTPLAPDRDATNWCTQKALIRQERIWAAGHFSSGDPGAGGHWNLSTDGVGGVGATRSAAFDPNSAANNDLLQWDDAGSTPIEDIREGRRHVLENSGYMPNVLILSRPVYDILVDHGDIVGRLDRGQTTGPALVNRDSLAALFEVDQVLVMDGVYNTAGDGVSGSYDFIGGKHALLLYRTSAPSITEPSAGYTFVWTGLLGSQSNGIRVKRFRMEPLSSDRIEAEIAVDIKRTSSDLGYFFDGIVS